MSMIDKAKQFATTAHLGQIRKKSKRPYICHPFEVVCTLQAHGYNDEDILAAAWLHDVVEDCGVTLEEIEKEFNSNIALLVGQLTKSKDIDMYTQIKNASNDAKIIKCADRICNIMEIDWFKDKAWLKSYYDKTIKLSRSLDISSPIFTTLVIVTKKVGYLLGEIE